MNDPDETAVRPVTYLDAERDDVNAPERYEELVDRDLMARSAPEDHPPLTALECLEVIANGEALARYYRHPSQVDEAVRAGASWQQIADALGDTEEAARGAYRGWAEGRHKYGHMTDADYARALELAGRRS